MPYANMFEMFSLLSREVDTNIDIYFRENIVVFACRRHLFEDDLW